MANGEKGKGRSKNQRLKLLYLLESTVKMPISSIHHRWNNFKDCSYAIMLFSLSWVVRQ